MRRELSGSHGSHCPVSRLYGQVNAFYGTSVISSVAMVGQEQFVSHLGRDKLGRPGSDEERVMGEPLYAVKYFDTTDSLFIISLISLRNKSTKLRDSQFKDLRHGPLSFLNGHLMTHAA